MMDWHSMMNKYSSSVKTIYYTMLMFGGWPTGKGWELATFRIRYVAISIHYWIALEAYPYIYCQNSRH